MKADMLRDRAFNNSFWRVGDQRSGQMKTSFLILRKTSACFWPAWNSQQRGSRWWQLEHFFLLSPLKLGEDEPMFYSCFFGWVQTSNHQVEKLNQCWRPHMHWFSSEGILLRGCSNLWFRIHTAPGRKIKEWCPCKRGSQVWHHGSLMQIPSRILQKSHHSAHG